MAERYLCKVDVVGSIPIVSTRGQSVGKPSDRPLLVLVPLVLWRGMGEATCGNTDLRNSMPFGRWR